MFMQLNTYKTSLNNLLGRLEDKDPASEAAQDKLDEQISELECCIDIMDELIDALKEYQDTYKGLNGIK